MSVSEDIVKKVNALLEKEPRVNLHRAKVRTGFSDGILTLEGEVGNVAAKKVTLVLAAGVSGVINLLESEE